MNQPNKPLVIYHANCADGFTAAWAVSRAIDADFHAASYGAAPPAVAGRNVIFVDFCYPCDVMLTLQLSAASILVLDHHKTADEILCAEHRTAPEHLTVVRMDQRWKAPHSWEYYQGCIELDRCEGINKALIYALIDINRSGAGIAWDFFHNTPRPELVSHVEDRDLWRFDLPGTREISAAIFSYEYTFPNWDKLAAMAPNDLRRQGESIERKHHKDVAELVAVCQRTLTIGGYAVPAASLPHIFTSDAGALMAQGQPFAACYWDTAEGRVFSLQSQADGLDVSAIAQRYNGGGHRNAAGFRVPRDHELARA
ncbi:hypothetical protein ABE493_07705 [Stenotrophomonas terrae]|uniref:hypothetical protein n=1 Tax=Stenotrophomonas terrae TaxID=405446 RepID=UPI00320AED12